MVSVEDGDEKKQDGCCKVFWKFMFSHIGLCAMVVLYSVAGGFIFEHLERENEKAVCTESLDEYVPMQDKTLENLKKVILENNLNTDAMMIQMKSILQTFRNNSLAIGYDGRNCDGYGEPNGPTYEWSWAGALMFSVTVITTIGYGHIAPKTFWGRLVCIAYSLLGIPLMLLCLANIGDVLADIFRFVYSKICCCGCCRKKQKDKVVSIKPTSEEPDSAWNDKTKIIPNNKAPMGTEFSKIQDDSTRPKIKTVDIKTLNKTDLANRNMAIRNQPMIVDDDSDDEDDDFDEKKVTVPLTVTLVVIFGYIMGGALLFGLWEGWDLLQSAYFCFVTLSTIGFGDVVPGTDFDNPQATAQLILGAIYVLFGMAILSMCFALMQDEIISKCTWIGQKLGIVDKEQDDD
ncbi:KCNKI-like protein [Mya arenaria]|uniref:KCNKI-like protein n=1 Tax=Mya arenaria TaxID=6604 RepID=A0ABY7DTC7_MYAAR|nr:TWiK family of potassium channels protein 7-like [Mya arenaria]XP_052795952.1 TWiK family of potassium channels protein 7-like [Mya arenaria]WAQ99861.1 KCNKI-like protein [Mya arenaria]